MKNIDEKDDYDIVFTKRNKSSDVETDQTMKMNTNNSNGTGPKKTKPKKNKAAKKLKVQRIIAVILIVCVGLGVIGTATIWGFAASAMKKSPDMYEEDFFAMTSSELLDSNGESYHKTGLKATDAIEYDDLPQVLVDAFIATEDSRFFEHKGVDIPRFTKAMMINVKDSIKRMRFTFSQGGSTITMQLLKNTYFVSENVQTGEGQLAASTGIAGVERKMQELYLATKLEKEKILTKKEQITFYLNTTYFGAGSNTMGIQTSVKRYFDKDVSELNLIESAFLAGVINAPNSYSPYSSIRKAKERTHTVLELMNLHGYISESELAVAKAIEIENIFVDRNQKAEENLVYQAYIDVVYKEIKEAAGMEITDAPMIVHTNMNRKVQEGIDKVQRREIAKLNPGENSEIQMGSIIVENGTGAIVGVFGGYDYDGALIHNRARDIKETPGSVVKAVLSYPLAFEHLGISTEHIVTDSPYVLAGMTAENNGQVNSYDNAYLGDIPLKFAFADSRNSVAITMFEEASKVMSKPGVIQYMQDLGFVDIKAWDPQLAIGGNKFATSPIQLAEAVSTIMNNGENIKPSTITKIEFLDGREPIIVDPEVKELLSPGAAYLTTELMKHAVSGPNAGFLAPTRRPYPVFGKTGTSQWDKTIAAKLGIPKGAAQNRNMITATDRFSMATWVGFDKHETKDHYLNDRITSMNLPGNLNSYFLDLLANEYGPGKEIARPDDVVEITHIKGPFPYQRPIEGMREDMIVTGSITKKALKLEEPKPQSLDNLKEATVESSQMGDKVTANITLTPYPDETKLTVAPDTKDMILPTTTKVYKGRRLYDDSWLYGAVDYVVDVVVDGEVVETLRSSHNTIGITRNVPKGSKLSLCGYYGYSNMKAVESNKICQDIEIKEVEEETILVPALNTPIGPFKDAANKAGLKYKIKSLANPDINLLGTVAAVSNGADNKSYAGQNVAIDLLKKDSKFTITLHDYVFDIQKETATKPMTQGEFYNKFKTLINIKEPSAEDAILPLTAFDGNLGKVNLLSYDIKQLKLK